VCSHSHTVIHGEPRGAGKWLRVRYFRHTKKHIELIYTLYHSHPYKFVKIEGCAGGSRLGCAAVAVAAAWARKEAGRGLAVRGHGLLAVGGVQEKRGSLRGWRGVAWAR